MKAEFNVSEEAPSPQTKRFAGAHGSFIFLPALLCLAFFWPFNGGGSKKIQMMAGNETPAAQATVTAQIGKNDNTELNIKAHALAQPSSLTPPANVYVVWVQPPGDSPKNLGELNVDNKLNGELHTETPYKRFSIFITAEKDAQVQQPQGPRILSADVAQGF
jgi:hypothetical protein